MGKYLGNFIAIRRNASSKKDKFRGVQILRAVAATLVVYAHAITIVASESAPAQAKFFFLQNFGAVGVDIFFVISGFVISLAVSRAPHWIDFLGRRVLRIFPLYWLLTFVSAVTVSSGITPVTLVKSFFFVPPLVISLGWTLCFEMLFYLMLAVHLAIFPRRALWAAIVSFAGLMAARQMFGVSVTALNLIGNPIILEFLAGAVIGLAFSRLGTSRPWGILALTTGAGSLVRTIFTGFGNVGAAHYTVRGTESWHRLAVWGIGAAFMVGGVVFWNPRITSRAARFVALLGDASYSIYLVSWIVLLFCARILRYFTFWGSDIGVILLTCFSTASAVAVYLLIERPMTDFLQRTWKRTLESRLHRDA